MNRSVKDAIWDLADIVDGECCSQYHYCMGCQVFAKALRVLWHTHEARSAWDAAIKQVQEDEDEEKIKRAVPKTEGDSNESR